MQQPSRGAWATAAFLVFTPAVAIAGGLGLAPLQAAAGLIGAPWTRLWTQAKRAWPFLALLGAFGAWVAVSALWSPVRDTQQGWRLLGGLACGLLFVASVNGTATSRRLVRATALAALIVLAGLALVEASYDTPLNRFGQPGVSDPGVLERNPGRGVAILVMLFWAGVGGWASGGGVVRALGWVMAPIVAWLGFNFGMAVNVVSFGAGLIAFTFGMLAPRIALQTMSTVFGVWLVAAPWILPGLLSRVHAYFHTLPDSWAVRTEIWRFVSARIAEHPWIGMGLDASRTFAGRTVTQNVAHDLVPLHPHNAALHIWLETGLVGAALAASAVIVGGWMAARALQPHRTTIASACAAFAVLAVLWNVSYGAWQEWMVAGAFACAGLVAATRRGSS